MQKLTVGREYICQEDGRYFQVIPGYGASGSITRIQAVTGTSTAQTLSQSGVQYEFDSLEFGDKVILQISAGEVQVSTNLNSTSNRNLTAGQFASPTAAILADTSATYIGPDGVLLRSNGSRLTALLQVDDVRQRGAVSGTGLSKLTELQAAINDKPSGTGGDIFLPEGIFDVNAPLYINNKVRLFGQGEGSVIRATSDFTGASVVIMGAVADTFAFGCTLNNLKIEVSAKNVNAIRSTKLQENASIERVWISGILNVHAIDLRSIVENCMLSEVYIASHSSATSPDGIYLETVPWIILRRITCDFSNVSGGKSAGAGIELNDSAAYIQDVHMEGLTDGVLIYNNSRAHIYGAHGINVSTLVNLAAGSRHGNKFYDLVNGSSVTTIITDNLNTKSLAGSVTAHVGDVSSYNEGDNYQIGGFTEMLELAADPAAPGSNNGRLYVRDNGGGKTQLVIRFPTGAIQVIATEP